MSSRMNNTSKVKYDEGRLMQVLVAPIVSEKATPDDAAAVREWLLEAAQEAANAAKEGGFMGFHAERVSEGEQRMLDSLKEALAAPSS